jgi:C_GCAxxG_C_C family probable redox protein
MAVERESNVEKAVSLFKDGFSCSQAVCAAYAEHYGLNREAALRISGGFGGGIGRMGETCGALSGAIIIIGLKHSGVKADDKAARLKTYEVVREFLKRFRSRNNSILCRELISCDISTPEGFKRAMDEKIIPTRCPKFVKDAAEILEEIVWRNGEMGGWGGWGDKEIGR